MSYGELYSLSFPCCRLGDRRPTLGSRLKLIPVFVLVLACSSFLLFQPLEILGVEFRLFAVLCTVCALLVPLD